MHWLTVLFTAIEASNFFDKYCRWIEGYGSPPDGPNGFSGSHGGLKFSAASPKEIALEIMPDILRLSIDCPYVDVRDRCGSMLHVLKVNA